MPEGSYPFPMYSGLLEPRHYKNIGNAIWLFLWCISSTTTEEEKEGTVWGFVLRGKPMKLSEISGHFGVNEKTVSRWLDTLEQHDYIRITRAPRGLILAVKNSKKYTDRNVRSVESDRTKMSYHPGGEETKMSDHGNSDKTNLSDHSTCDQTEMSDLKDITTTTPITTTDREWFEDESGLTSRADGMIVILNAYCKLHGKLDFHVKPREREAMGRMVAGGMPVPFTISTMESLLQAKRDREGDQFKLPTSFLYYVDAINEAWQNSRTTCPPIAGVAQGKPTASKRMSKQDKKENLRRIAEEEESKHAQG